jgi:hypothetical protein
MLDALLPQSDLLQNFGGAGNGRSRNKERGAETGGRDSVRPTEEPSNLNEFAGRR